MSRPCNRPDNWWWLLTTRSQCTRCEGGGLAWATRDVLNDSLGSQSVIRFPWTVRLAPFTVPHPSSSVHSGIPSDEHVQCPASQSDSPTKFCVVRFALTSAKCSTGLSAFLSTRQVLSQWLWKEYLFFSAVVVSLSVSTLPQKDVFIYCDVWEMCLF